MGRGGKRPGAGRKPGVKKRLPPGSISKEEGREILRQLVLQQMKPLVQAQLDNARGLRHTFLRDAAGRFVQLTDPKQIEDALNSGDEGKYYWTHTKDPSIQAFTDLMNRALDKPKEQEQDVNLDAVLRFKHELD